MLTQKLKTKFFLLLSSSLLFTNISFANNIQINDKLSLNNNNYKHIKINTIYKKLLKMKVTNLEELTKYIIISQDITNKNIEQKLVKHLANELHNPSLKNILNNKLGQKYIFSLQLYSVSASKVNNNYKKEMNTIIEKLLQNYSDKELDKKIKNINNLLKSEKDYLNRKLLQNTRFLLENLKNFKNYELKNNKNFKNNLNNY